LECFSAFTGLRISKALELDWRLSAVSLSATKAGHGLKGKSTGEQLSIFRFPQFKHPRKSSVLKPILLVEDNVKDLELTLVALERTRLANDVIVARDGEEALDYLFCRGQHANRQQGNPAVVLLDLKLPKIDGLEVLENIRRTDGLRRLPVVILTSSREERDVVKSYDLGVNAYVVKPVGFPEFIQAIQELGVFWAVLNEPPPGSTKPIYGVDQKKLTLL
jgi:CheY-like chemotaxis protein